LAWLPGSPGLVQGDRQKKQLGKIIDEMGLPTFKTDLGLPVE
jgi:hypothetical protein